MSTCADPTCRATLVPAREWRTLTADERAEKYAQGYAKAQARGLCHRCHNRLSFRGTEDSQPRLDPVALTGGRWVLVRGVQRWVA